MLSLRALIWHPCPHLRATGIVQIKVTVVILQMHAAEGDLYRSPCP